MPNREADRPMRIDHAALWVADLERARDFYVSGLGGRGGPLYENPRTGFRSYFVTFAGGARLELMARRQPPFAGPVSGEGPEESRGTTLVERGWAHVAFVVGSRAAVDEAVLRLEARGIVIAGRPRLTGDGYYEAVIEDPEGNRVELMAEAESVGPSEG